ncbi:MAG TPA: hypothetical protein VNI78_01665 [Vicinamibacterales bacterium]|nr:hypothetical protein [Vicinamibacterales bacterium]
MTVRTIDGGATGTRVPDARWTGPAMLYAAPFAAIIAGMAAQWLDFRALRLPLLLLVLAGVIASSIALSRARRPAAAFGVSVVTGALTWAAAQVVYTILHVASGQEFSFDRLGGPQPVQALGLIVAHAAFLGLPTGIAAGVALLAARRARLLR